MAEPVQPQNEVIVQHFTVPDEAERNIDNARAAKMIHDTGNLYHLF